MKAMKSLNTFFKNLFLSALSIIKIIVKSRFSSKLPEVADKKCLILGNGPSLKETILNNEEEIHSYEKICVNTFSVSQEYKKFKPKHYILLDPGWWEFPEEGRIKKALDAIRDDTTWEMNILVPFEAKKSKVFDKLAAENSCLNVFYFNYTVLEGFDFFKHWLYKINLGTPQCQNVMVACLFLAINMGYKNVTIVGADHSWHKDLVVNDNNVVCIEHHHFYHGKDEIKLVPFKKVSFNEDVFTMEEAFFTLSKVFKGYEEINKYARVKGVNIFNGGIGSFVDAFKRIKL